MGYYTRVFCKSDTKPTIREVIEYLNKLDYNFRIETNLSSEERNSLNWTNLELKYKTNKLPILVECNNVLDADGFAKKEIEEFIDNIGVPGFFSIKKKKVIEHLRNTAYVITNQLPTSDIDDDGYDANGEFLKYFACNYNGIIQADGEGFYEGTKVILKTE